MESNSIDQAVHLREEMRRTHSEKPPLPTRSELHRKKRSKNKWKVKFPLLKLLSLSFVLLPIAIYSAYQYFGNHKSENPEAKSGFETVEVFKDEKLDNKTASSGIEGTNEQDSTHADSQRIQKEAAHTNQSAAPADPRSPDSEDKLTARSQESKDEQSLNHSNEGYKIIYHTVKPKETVFRIAMNYYNSQEGIMLIREWNGLEGNEISSGQVLKIPIKQ